MLYLLDTANLKAIQDLTDYYPVSGVTTNPTIISHERADFETLISGIRSIIGKDRMLHVQATGKTCEEIVREALALNSFDKGNLYIKVPVSREGVKAIKVLKEKGIKVTATAIFTQQQALVCARAGADFVAPYINRLDNIVSDGTGVASDISHLFHLYNLPTKVLDASFKNVEQFHKVSMAGIDAVTVNPELLESLLCHPLTTQAIADFSADWASVYGKDADIADLLENDISITA